jgi:hypothetical protein
MQKRKLTEEQVKEIQEMAKTTIKRVDIARLYGVSPQLISTVIQYGYTDRRPDKKRDRSKMPSGEFESWEALARDYNLLYPDDKPLNGAEIKAIHDLAIKKIMQTWAEEGLVAADFL